MKYSSKLSVPWSSIQKITGPRSTDAWASPTSEAVKRTRLKNSWPHSYITDCFTVEKYIIGLCNEPRLGNTFFTGNCFGTIMPFLGFGQFASILSGIYAAHDLSGQGSYEELTGPLRLSYRNSLVLRKFM